MPPEAYFWLILMVILLVVEAATWGLTTIWFAAGAMVAAIFAAFGFNFIVQIFLALLISTLLLLLLRPVAKQLLSTKRSATNSDRVFEKRGKVTESIDNIEGTGAVYVDGKTWTARSYSGEPIAVDVHVRVNLIEGVKLIVSPIDLSTAPETIVSPPVNPVDF